MSVRGSRKALTYVPMEMSCLKGKISIILSSVALIAGGLPLAILGYQGKFNYVSCPQAAFQGCINVFTFSDLAVVGGSLPMIIGAIIVIVALKQGTDASSREGVKVAKQS